jgi:hypothetical protein
MSKNDQSKNIGLIRSSDEVWDQWFCQNCGGNGVTHYVLNGQSFSREVICTDCHGKGDKRMLRPVIYTNMHGPVHFITGSFYEFGTGNRADFFLYSDLVWRSHTEYIHAKCFFSLYREAKNLLNKVS